MTTGLVVRSVQATPVRVPLAKPHRTASGTINDSLLVLIDVDCGDVVGRSYIFVYSPAVLAATASLVETFGEAIVGRLVEPTALYDELQAQFRILGTTGLVGYVLGSLDMALWDAHALSVDKPLWQALGGVARSTPVYESMGMMNPEDTRSEAEAAAAKGVTAFKVKAGHPDPRHDRAVGETLRSVAGASGDIMFDYNQAFTADEAIERLGGLADLSLRWIEEPVSATDLDGHRLVRESCTTPVQTGENWWGPDDMHRALDAQACDVAMIDASRIGGVTGWVRAAAVAEKHSIPLSTHFYPEMSVHVMCVTPTAHYIEWLDVSGAIVADPLVVVDGSVKPPDAPGTGIGWDADAVKRFVL